MSGSRMTRKVTVEGSKKTSDSNAPRKSVFDRLGPGTLERGPPRRDDYHEPQTEKCRHWFRDGRCPFGNKCRYNHGSTSDSKSKVKIVRSIVSSKTDDSSEGKNEARLKRFPNAEESPPEQFSKKPSKKKKSEKIKSTSEHIKEEHRHKELREPREYRREKEEAKVEKKKDGAVRRSLSSSGWNLQDQSESDEATDSKQMDWEERGALNYEREVALEERRNDLRRQIAKIDQHVEPVVTIPNNRDDVVQGSTPVQIGDVKPEKKKKSKSEKSKKKSKKKSHKSEVAQIQSERFRTESESSEKVRKLKSPVTVKKKKKHDHRVTSNSEFLPSETPPKKQEFQRESPQHDISPPQRISEVSPVEITKDSKSKSRHHHESRREKLLRPSLQPEQFEKYYEEEIPRLDIEKNRKKQKGNKSRVDERSIGRQDTEGRGVEVLGIEGHFEGKNVEEGHFGGRSMEGRSMEGRSMEGRSVEGRSVEGRSVEGRSVEGRSVEGRSVEGRSVEGRSVEGRSMEGRSVEGRSMEGRSMEGRSMEGRSVEGRSVEGRSVEGRSMEGRSMEGRNTDGRSIKSRNMEGRGVEGRDVEMRFMEGRSNEGRNREERSGDARVMEERGSEVRGMVKRGVEERPMERQSKEGRGIEGRGDEGRGMERHATEGRGGRGRSMEGRDVEGRDAEGRGNERRDVDGRDMQRRDMEEQDMEKRDMEKRDMEKRDMEKRDMEKRDMEGRDVEERAVEERAMEVHNFEERNIGRSKENRLRKKGRSDKDMKQRVENIAEVSKSASHSLAAERKGEKRHGKKQEKQKESAPLTRLPGKNSNKVTKSGMRDEGEKARGPRTPSPEVKRSSTSLRNVDSSRDSHNEPHIKHAEKSDVEIGDSKNTRPEFQVSSLETSIPKQPKSFLEDKQQLDENSSVSSDIGSATSEHSAGCDVESISGEELQADGDHGNDLQHKSSTPESKHGNRGEKRAHVQASMRNRDYPDRSERERLFQEPRERSFNEPREQAEDHKERLLELNRRDERSEKYHREREHRRPRDEEPERRGQKDPRETRESRDFRDHRETREFREMPRVDNRDPRDRERYHELSERERERHPPNDFHRTDIPSKPRDHGDKAGYGRGGWSRERHGRGRGGYSSYDNRGQDDRRAEGRLVQDRPERGHPSRGSRYREMSERQNMPWHERRSEKSYREPERERERFPDNRERFHDDTRGGRPKRPPRSPEGSRNDRRGFRGEEQERRPGTPLEESEEWDYEEGHSPGAQTKDQVIVSRKRPRSPRSPRSEATKRMKAASPQEEPARLKDRMPETTEGQTKSPSEHEKHNEKDSKRSKKDKGKKTRKRKLSETEQVDTSENVETPERKRKRESEMTSKEKQVKKSKLKNQPEVVVRPWSDLENDEDDQKGQSKQEKNASDSKIKDKVEGGEQDSQVFSDWSDASEDNMLGKAESNEAGDIKNANDEKLEEKGEKKDMVGINESVDDVYDPISDDEFEAMFVGDEDETAVKKKTTPVAFDEVDWSILGSSVTRKDAEPGDYIKQFSAGKIFSKIGLSSSLAGPILTKKVQEKCLQDAPNMKMKDLLANPSGTRLSLGALISAEVRKMKERSGVVDDIGPCRRGLCARRDFYIRKQLRKLTSTRLGAKLVLSDSSVEPVDNELFGLSVSLYRRDKQRQKTEVQVDPSKLAPDSSAVVVC